MRVKGENESNHHLSTIVEKLKLDNLYLYFFFKDKIVLKIILAKISNFVNA